MKITPRFAIVLIAALFAPVLSHAEPNTLSPEEKADGWQLLFDGKTLDGWKPTDHPETFKVEDGCIVTSGPCAHLYYDGPIKNHDFTNFDLRMEVMTYPKANSGVYIHTTYQPSDWPKKGYEVQINNTAKDAGSRTGSLFIIQDNKVPPVADEVWFTLRVRVENKHIVIWINDKVISDYTEPPSTVRHGTMAGWVFSHGTFALQAHDPGSRVQFRNIAVKPLP